MAFTAVFVGFHEQAQYADLATRHRTVSAVRDTGLSWHLEAPALRDQLRVERTREQFTQRMRGRLLRRDRPSPSSGSVDSIIDAAWDANTMTTAKSPWKLSARPARAMRTRRVQIIGGLEQRRAAGLKRGESAGRRIRRRRHGFSWCSTAPRAASTPAQAKAQDGRLADAGARHLPFFKARAGDPEVLDLSRLTSECSRVIYPCREHRVSTGGSLCHWPLLPQSRLRKPGAGLDERHLSDVGGGARHYVVCRW